MLPNEEEAESRKTIAATPKVGTSGGREGLAGKG